MNTREKIIEVIFNYLYHKSYAEIYSVGLQHMLKEANIPFVTKDISDAMNELHRKGIAERMLDFGGLGEGIKLTDEGKKIVDTHKSYQLYLMYLSKEKRKNARREKWQSVNRIITPISAVIALILSFVNISTDNKFAGKLKNFEKRIDNIERQITTSNTIKQSIDSSVKSKRLR